MSNRQFALALQEDFIEMCKAFAATHNLKLAKTPRVRYSTTDIRMGFTDVEFGELVDGVAEEGLTPAIAIQVVTGIIRADVLAYPEGAREVMEAAAVKGDLFVISANVMGRITGWNSRAPKSPLQFTATCKNGEPCAPTQFKTRSFRADSIGIRANASDVLDLQVGDQAFVDYTGDDSDPEDASGFYRVTIKSLGKDHAIVTYDNGVEDSVVFSQLIIRPRFI